MRFLHTVLTVTTVIYYHNCYEHTKFANKTLYNEIVDYFFPKELRNTKIKIDFYLCQFKLSNKLCCHCAKTYKYYGSCCIDAFFENSISSVEEYVTLFLRMTNMRRYVNSLTITNDANISSNFLIDQVPTVAYCENEHSPYASLCNGSDLSNDVRVIADEICLRKQILRTMPWF